MRANKERSLYNWLYQNRWTIILPVVIGLLVHFGLYSNVLFNPDSSYWWGEYRPGAWEVSLGRWGWQYVMALRGYLVSPMLVTVLLLLFYSLAGNMLSDLFDAKGILRVLISLTIICSTMAAGTIANYYCADAFALAYLLACASAICVVKIKNSVLGVLAGALMLAFSLGIYQSNIGVAAVVCVMYIYFQCALKECDVRSVLLSAKNFLLMGICGVTGYLVILKIHLKLTGVELSGYKGANSVSLSNIIKSLGQSIPNAYSDFFAYFFGSNTVMNTYGIKQMNILLCCVFLLALGYTVYQAIKAKKVIQICVALFCLAIVPITANLIDVAVPGTRISATILTAGGPCTVPGFLIAAICLTAPKWSCGGVKLIRTVTLACSIGLIWGSVLLSNANSIVMQVNNNRTVELAGRICQTLEENGYAAGDKAIIIGSPNFGNYLPLNPLLGKADPYVACEMVWRERSEQYWANILYRHYGLYIFQGQSWAEPYEDADRIEASEEFKAMPLYPREGSIQKIDDIYVVKVSN